MTNFGSLTPPGEAHAIMHQDGVTGPIIGPRTLAQLDEIFPRYKPAPEHYAW